MIAHGDEIGRTQHGNNNVYCQDTELVWIDWSLADDDADLLDVHPRRRSRCGTSTRCSGAAGSSRASRSAPATQSATSPGSTRTGTEMTAEDWDPASAGSRCSSTARRSRARRARRAGRRRLVPAVLQRAHQDDRRSSLPTDATARSGRSCSTPPTPTGCSGRRWSSARASGSACGRGRCSCCADRPDRCRVHRPPTGCSCAATRFTFADAADLVDYLADLGVSHLYLSPVLHRRAGLDARLRRHRPDRGRRPRSAVADGLRGCGRGAGAGWAWSSTSCPTTWRGRPRAEPRAWWDVLRHGRDSPYAALFDIDWDRATAMAGSCCRCSGSTTTSPRPRRSTASVLRLRRPRFPDRAGHRRRSSAQTCTTRSTTGWSAGADGVVPAIAGSSTSRRWPGCGVEDPAVFDATHAEVRRWFADGIVDGSADRPPRRAGRPGGLPAGCATRRRGGVDRGREDPGGRRSAGPRLAGRRHHRVRRAARGRRRVRRSRRRTALDRLARAPPAATAASVPDWPRRLKAEARRARTAGRASSARVVAPIVAAAGAGPPAAARGGRRAGRAISGSTAATTGRCRRCCRSACAETLPPAGSGRRRWRRSPRPLARGGREPARAVPAALRRGDGQGRRGHRLFYRETAVVAQRGRRRPDRSVSRPRSSTHAPRVRRRQWPPAMTTLSTHDTKRGEDVRARLGVLSQVAGAVGRSSSAAAETARARGPTPRPVCSCGRTSSASGRPTGR